ncbi:very low-density lipoprotein receptor-like [Gigantopelta aegis]|uniref:very low-density lipoprotein receptor-like n=1 Tax=Gigantopelta aegis TaxID=1735272 RepID=UPI001B889B6A|nr:very low-density lipoprotein receptor-like [Gigantopelta aegis]
MMEVSVMCFLVLVTGLHSANMEIAVVTCAEEDFTCEKDHKCIPLRWHCDKEPDCPDASDEKPEDCSKKVCPHGHFSCKNGVCLPPTWVCDGSPDCADGDDEDKEKCKETTCREDQFKCVTEGYCINSRLKCNGDKDCLDGSDELNCPSKASQCSEDEFDCNNDGSECIPHEQVCNGIKNCANFMDELDSMCPETNPCDLNNGGCNQKCVNKFREHTHVCECYNGYRLMNGSTTTCKDIDECKIFGSCSQNCDNTKGGYKCSCVHGYTLKDHRYCKADGPRSPELLLAARKDLRKINLETYHYTLLVSEEKVFGAIAMDFDYDDNMLFWTDVAVEQVLKANFDNISDVKVVADNETVQTPDGLAVDWIYKHIYWTDTGLDRIQVSTMDGSMRKTLVDTDLDEPRAIVVDPQNGYMYWTDWGNKAKIERCGMNGQGRVSIIEADDNTHDIIWPNGLTIDYVDQRLYWIDAKLHKISSINLNGGDMKVVLRSHVHLNHPFAITVFEDYLYWTDWPSESVRKFTKFGSDTDSVQTIALDLHSPMDVQVFHKYRQPTSANVCGSNNGGCSHFCLPAPNSATGSMNFTCECPDGFVHLPYDLTKCVLAEETTCREDQFKCVTEGYCINSRLKCNGDKDCLDGSDELDCPSKASQCSEDEFDCNNDGSECISHELVCNGIKNCANFMDELASMCPASPDINETNPCDLNNGGCNQNCVNKFREHTHVCECYNGYRLMNGSTTICKDVNECEIFGSCSQHCDNTKGGYKCSCVHGYTLKDHRYCKADGPRSPELLLADRKDLRKINLETYHYTLLVSEEKVFGAVAMDFDYVDNMLFWTDVAVEQVLKANLDNISDVKVVADNKTVQTPDGLAVDWIYKHIYWTDTGLDRIQVSTMDGSMRKTLVDTDLDEPRAIVVDPQNGYMYWTDWGNKAKIEKCGMNGQGRVSIIEADDNTHDIVWPNGLTIDYVDQRLYWIDAKLHKISSINLNGGDMKVVLCSHVHLNHPFAVTVFEDYLYWTDWPSESVRKFTKFGSDTDSVQTIALDLHSPMDVQVFHKYRQPTSANVCGSNNGGCSHFCLPAPNSATGSVNFTCECPDGFVHLPHDLTKCVPAGSVELSTKVPVATQTSKHTEVEVTLFGPGGYTIVSNGKWSDTVEAGQFETKEEENIGRIAGIVIVIGILLTLIIIIVVIVFVIYRRYRGKHGKSMNFDNPSY